VRIVGVGGSFEAVLRRRRRLAADMRNVVPYCTTGGQRRRRPWQRFVADLRKVRVSGGKPVALDARAFVSQLAHLRLIHRARTRPKGSQNALLTRELRQ
jgi:hypothetical protein